MRFLPLMVALTSAPVEERHLASNGLAGHATKGCGELSSSALQPQSCTWAPGHLDPSMQLGLQKRQADEGVQAKDPDDLP